MFRLLKLPSIRVPYRGYRTTGGRFQGGGTGKEGKEKIVNELKEKATSMKDEMKAAIHKQSG
jgi:hypothetical protein